jgi:hypothetical protein
MLCLIVWAELTRSYYRKIHAAPGTLSSRAAGGPPLMERHGARPPDQAALTTTVTPPGARDAEHPASIISNAEPAKKIRPPPAILHVSAWALSLQPCRTR